MTVCLFLAKNKHFGNLNGLDVKNCHHASKVCLQTQTLLMKWSTFRAARQRVSCLSFGTQPQTARHLINLTVLTWCEEPSSNNRHQQIHVCHNAAYFLQRLISSAWLNEHKCSSTSRLLTHLLWAHWLFKALFKGDYTCEWSKPYVWSAHGRWISRHHELGPGAQSPAEAWIMQDQLYWITHGRRYAGRSTL